MSARAYVLGSIVLCLLIGTVALLACTPIPYTPEQRCMGDPKCGATDWPVDVPTDTARPRDAGADR